MPELHRLTPILGVLQDAGQGRTGHRRSHVGRFRQGSGRHSRDAGSRQRRAARQGPRRRPGAPRRRSRHPEVLVPAAEWDKREVATRDLAANQHGCGRELFVNFRANAIGAEQGGSTFGSTPARPRRTCRDLKRVRCAGGRCGPVSARVFALHGPTRRLESVQIPPRPPLGSRRSLKPDRPLA